MEMKKIFEEVRYEYNNEELMKTHCQQMVDDGWTCHVQGINGIWNVAYRKGRKTSYSSFDFRKNS